MLRVQRFSNYEKEGGLYICERKNLGFKIRWLKPKPINEKLRLRSINRLICRPLIFAHNNILSLTRYSNSHWTYLLQILSKLCFQRVALSGNYEIVAISTDKNTFLMTLIIKLTLGNIFIKVKNPPGGATITK